jgi:hypothetical protein
LLLQDAPGVGVALPGRDSRIWQEPYVAPVLFSIMSDREIKIQELLNAVERLLSHLGHQVPVEVVHVEDLMKLIKELRNGSA